MSGQKRPKTGSIIRPNSIFGQTQYPDIIKNNRILDFWPLSETSFFRFRYLAAEYRGLGAIKQTTTLVTFSNVPCLPTFQQFISFQLQRERERHRRNWKKQSKQWKQKVYSGKITKLVDTNCKNSFSVLVTQDLRPQHALKRALLNQPQFCGTFGNRKSNIIKQG